MAKFRILIVLILSIYSKDRVSATNYYVHPVLGNDDHSGTSKELAFQTLERASKLDFRVGDQLLLASGYMFEGNLSLINQHGSLENPIVISTSTWEDNDKFIPALINCKNKANGILIQGSSNIEVSHVNITGNGFDESYLPNYKMRCGVLLINEMDRGVKNITLKNLEIFEVFFQNKGFTRGENEVKTPNGTQKYGWGIRVINNKPETEISNISIENCKLENIAHTGIKFTGKAQNIHHISVTGNRITKTGGPGIQMSHVHDVYVQNNIVSYSGSNDDSRKWGRGSGLWTWSSSRVLIEKNSFTHANGPGDSAGAHIDFNCDNIIIQYNLSAYNAGGFCEVLGNTYNCAYRFNVSINDGHRIKGIDGAFQEGKVFWLSGYQGKKKKRKGPANFYFYNNTIYCDSSIVSRIAIDKTSKGILIVNNIFCLRGGSQIVLGDQYKADSGGGEQIKNVVFHNNVFLNKDNWPDEAAIHDHNPFFLDPGFANEGGDLLEDYSPGSVKLLRQKSAKVKLITEDSHGLWLPLRMETDILGKPIGKRPGLGAISPAH